MTYTVFVHIAGDNETLDVAPGRGGYSIVIVDLPPEKAAVWWENEFGKDPDRTAVSHQEVHGDQAWEIHEAHTEDDAREYCGTKELQEGAIGVVKERLWTWNELEGRLDVGVYTGVEV